MTQKLFLTAAGTLSRAEWKEATEFGSDILRQFIHSEMVQVLAKNEYL